ncbi:hypothetical protein LMH73_015675 [Vibrio splendidus]|nr:hypothetical protein [Vibrio splendidus]MCC4881472.1 hypothetical protein [Vibrio splendidus]
MKLSNKNRRKARFFKSEKSAYLCPIKDCNHEEKSFSDIGCLFEHLLVSHSTAEIEKKFRLKNIRIENKKNIDTFTLPHDIIIYVDDMVNETIILDEDDIEQSNHDLVNSTINQVINTNTAFGLNHLETIFVCNHTTHLKLTS